MRNARVTDGLTAAASCEISFQLGLNARRKPVCRCCEARTVLRRSWGRCLLRPHVAVTQSVPSLNVTRKQRAVSTSEITGQKSTRLPQGAPERTGPRGRLRWDPPTPWAHSGSQGPGRWGCGLCLRVGG